jgi:hypothetical protein
VGAVLASLPAGIVGYETGTGPVAVVLLWLALLPVIWLIVERQKRHNRGRHRSTPAPDRNADTATWLRYLQGRS